MTRLEAMEQGAQSLQAELEQAMRGEGAPDNKQEAHEADATTEGRKPMEWRDVRAILSNEHEEILKYVHKAFTKFMDALPVEYTDKETGETIVEDKEEGIWTFVKMLADTGGMVAASLMIDEENSETEEIFQCGMMIFRMIRGSFQKEGSLYMAFMKCQIEAFDSSESKRTIDTRSIVHLSIIFHRICEMETLLKLIESTYRELTRQDDETQ